MIEQSAIEERGRLMGLQPRGGGHVEIRDENREWLHVRAALLKPGDTWAYHGKVDRIDRYPEAGEMTVWAGIPAAPHAMSESMIVYAFTRVDDVPLP